MKSPLWLRATLQGSCSPYSVSAIPHSFDLVSPSSQHKARTCGGNTSSQLCFSPGVLAVTSPQSPLARSAHVATPSGQIVEMTSFLYALAGKRTGYWCVLTMPTTKRLRVKCRTAQIKNEKTAPICCCSYDTYIYLFTQRIFIEHLLEVKHCSWY